MKKAKIVCTLGPASANEKILSSMIKNGMDVARLNFSHGTHEEHDKNIQTVRTVSHILKKPVAILQDLQGIKIRIGKTINGNVNLVTGRTITLKRGDGLSTQDIIYISYPRLYEDVKIGNRILIDDGLILLKVKAKSSTGLIAKIVEGGPLKDKKGVNLPDSKIQLTSLTKKDQRDLDFGIEKDVDYIAVSFVRFSQDIKKVKDYMKRKGAQIPVIAKIEKPEALDNFDSILKYSDGIMIARGDLGVELNPEKVPIIQKKLILAANELGKVVITATQMLESMTHNARPTRAEAGDVANAVIDGTDALMLSGETSIGEYPVQTVKMMTKIIEYTEENQEIKNIEGINWAKTDMPYATCDAATKAAQDINAKAIIAFTNSGYTARLISKFRPKVPIIAFATSLKIQKNLSILWGVKSFFMEPMSNMDTMISRVENFLIKNNLVKRQDTIIIVASLPFNVQSKTNFFKLHKIQ